MYIQVRVKDRNRKAKIVNGLFDISATNIFCKTIILENMQHKKYNATIKASGRYKTKWSSAKANYKINLPKFLK